MNCSRANRTITVLLAVNVTCLLFFLIKFARKPGQLVIGDQRSTDFPGNHSFSGAGKDRNTGPWQHEWAKDCFHKLDLLQGVQIRHPSQNVKKTTLVYLKTYKTGSSTIQNVLLRFGDTNRQLFALPTIGHKLLEGVSNRTIPEWLEPFLGKLDIFCVHTNYPMANIAAMMKSNATWITSLRDPDYLFESLYAYYEMNKYFGKSFINFLEEPPELAHRTKKFVGVDYGVNQMIRDLGLDLLSTVDEKAVVDQINLLEKVYDLVMIAEYMDESLILLRHLLNWTMFDVLSLPTNARYAKPEDPLANLSLSHRRNLMSLNAADHALYNRFQHKFKKRVQQFGAERMAMELDALRCLQKAAYKACKYQRYRGKEVPIMFKPFGDTYGFFPTVQSSDPPELMWMCYRMAFAETRYIEQIRMQQFYWISKELLNN